jgi:hypothetical protein
MTRDNAARALPFLMDVSMLVTRHVTVRARLGRSGDRREDTKVSAGLKKMVGSGVKKPKVNPA